MAVLIILKSYWFSNGHNFSYKTRNVFKQAKKQKQPHTAVIKDPCQEVYSWIKNLQKRAEHDLDL